MINANVVALTQWAKSPKKQKKRRRIIYLTST